MTVVSNSGPLIALAQIDHFELLRLLYGTLLVPSAVQESDRSASIRAIIWLF